jgi:hypothetical protein
MTSRKKGRIDVSKFTIPFLRFISKPEMSWNRSSKPTSTVYFLRFVAKPEKGRFYLSDMTSWKQGRIDLSKPTVSFLRFISKPGKGLFYLSSMTSWNRSSKPSTVYFLRFVAKPEKGRFYLSDTEYTARPFDSDRKVQNTTRKDRMNLSLLHSFICSRAIL